MTSKKRCAIYTRAASESNNREQIIEQRRACVEYVAKHKDLVLVKKEYSDSGVSGRTISRPALNNLRGDARSGLIDVIVMTDATRLHRDDSGDYTDFLIQEFKKYGAEVRFTEHDWHYPPKDGMGTSIIVRTMKRAIFAQMECIMPDIKMCENDTCPMHQQCYRFMAKPDEWESVAYFTPLSDAECEHFMAFKREKFMRE